MILAYYGLRESPFGVTPDPRYLFATPTHREALASLLYGINSGLGFITLTAMPGMGKTTLLFETLSKIKEKAVTAFLFQTISTPTDLLKALLADLGVAQPQGTLIDLQLQLNEVLATQTAAGKRVVVVIDEAQNLEDNVLEMVRMLSNFESPRAKLMQIILAGQPQLARKLTEPQLLQLRQRISISAHLDPLPPSEVATYIQHRLAIAGYHGEDPLFTAPALSLIAQHSGGIPRNINNLCFNALSIGCATRSIRIGPEIIREVITDLDMDTNAGALTSVISAKGAEPVREPEPISIPEPLSSHIEKVDSGSSVVKIFVIAAVLLCVAGFAYFHFMRKGSDRATAVVSTVQPPVSAPPVPQPAAPAPAVTTDGAQADTPQTDTANTNSASTEPAKADPATTPAQDTPEAPARPAMPGHWVLAKPRQSLHSICTENYGICEPTLFQSMLVANTSLPNVNKIQPGQKIFVPTRSASSAQTKH